jgi:uncharacterized protein (TIGR03067 family)
VKEVSMRRTALLLLARAVACAVAAPLPFPKPDGSDLARLQGEWVCVLYTHEGAALNQGEVRAAVSGKRVVFSTNSKVSSTWTFTLDPGKRPKGMDLRQVVEDPLAAGQSLLAAYRVERDTLTISFVIRRVDSGRPSDLEGRKKGEYLMAFKRKG